MLKLDMDRKIAHEDTGAWARLGNRMRKGIGKALFCLPYPRYHSYEIRV